MTKDVLVSIAGLQYEDSNVDINRQSSQQEVIEMICRGEYYQKNGKHYIIYEELSEEDQTSITKCILKLTKDKVEIIKNGVNQMHMVFERNHSNISCYTTPFGEFMIGVTTKAIDLEETDQLIMANLQYILDINYQQTGSCDLKISVRGR